MKKRFLLQINKSTNLIVNIGVYEEDSDKYCDESGQVRDDFMCDTYRYVYKSESELRGFINNLIFTGKIVIE